MSQEITLTPEQEKAKESLLAFFLDDTPAIILQGHAGTGKTTLIKSVLDTYKNISKSLETLDITPKPIVLTATTHKACASLRQSVGMPVQTLHKYFAIDFEGKSRYFSLQKLICIVDEASYINDALLNTLKNFRNIKFLFIGDERQLTPVGANYASVFYDNIPTISLTQVIRQQNAPSIAEYCEKLRDCIDKTSFIPEVPHTPEIVHLEQADFLNTIYQCQDDYRVLAYKNMTVKRYNKLIMKKLLGREHLDVGDIAINNTADIGSLDNNEVVKIIKREKTSFHDYQGNWFWVERACGDHARVFVPDLISAIPKICKQFYGVHLVLKTLADLRPHYASTVHKAQGSTHHTVFIDLTDLRQTKTRDELRRLLYVAFSRATHKVYVTGGL